MATVAVIDDDYRPIKFEDLPEGIQRALMDEVSDEYKNALALLNKILVDGPPSDLKTELERYSADDNLGEFIQSQSFAQNVFLQHADDILVEQSLHVLDGWEAWPLRKTAQDLKGVFDKAFGAGNVHYFFDRDTDLATVAKFDFLILDLFVKHHADVIDELATYLKQLVAVCGSDPIPPILVMSSHAELKPNLGDLRFKSQISAAGMVAMSKAEILADQFGVDGVTLLWEQLQHQKNAASKTRSLALAWETALSDATAEASKTIWSLDASAMQQFHFTALRENDPYDEHLSDLLIREYLWHVEGNNGFQTALKALDEVLLEEIIEVENQSYDLAYRFPQHHPHGEVEAVTKIQSHYHWFGNKTILNLHSLEKSEFEAKFNRLVPFGALLTISEPKEGALAYIHVTQQCDLNKRDIFKNDSSALLLIAELVSPNDKGKGRKESEMIVPGFHAGAAIFDLVVNPTRFYAIPVQYLHQWIADQKLCNSGRLRLDVARQCLQLFLNHSSRPAAFSIQAKSVENFKIFYSEAGKDASEASHFPDPQDKSKAKLVEGVRAANTNKIIFSNDDSNHIALWLVSLCPGENIDDNKRSKIASQLRLGIPESGQLEHIPYATHIPRNFNRCKADIRGLNIKPEDSKLIFFKEPEQDAAATSKPVATANGVLEVQEK